MTWWLRFSRRKQMEMQLDKELRFHLEQHANDLIERGQNPAEARRQARLALGGPEQVKEHCRDARGTRWLEDLMQDFRYTLRNLRQNKGFAAVALLTLALGSGATTVMFTVINGVLLKPLPYREPDKLVTLHVHTERFGDQWFAYPNFLDFKRASRTLQPIAGWVYIRGTLTEPGEAEYVDGRQVSSEFFSLLGVSVLHGRAFLPEDDHPGAAPVAIISHSLWERRFSANANALGRRIVLDEKPYTVIGIAPADFRWYGDEVDVFTPLGQSTEAYMLSRKIHPIGVTARLRPGVTFEQAQSELTRIGRGLAEQYPQENDGRDILAKPLRPEVGDVRSTLWLLLGAVSLVLLIACVNVASLLLARAVSRERELAMRMALGAGRGRLVRQCLTESTVLSLAGGALGVLLAMAGLRPFVAFWPGSLPRAEEVRLDWHVLLFSLAASLLSGLLFGLAPALRTPTKELEQTLRAGARNVVGSSRRLHAGFVVSEIALAFVLLVSAGMLGRTLLALSSLDPGVDVRNLLTARMALSPATLAKPGRIPAAWQEALERARRVPGVESVAMVDTVPMREGNNPLGYWTSADIPPENRQPMALATSVTPDYLKVMGIALRQGRFFDDRDRMSGELVIVVDDVLAQKAFPQQDPVGKQLWIPDMSPKPLRVIGVVGHVRYWGLAGDDQSQVRAQIYYPFAQVPERLLRRWSELMSLAFRTSVPPLNVVDSLKRELRGAAGDQVLYEVHTMEQLASGSLARQRFLLLLFGIFAALALLLACVGIYGVLAYLIRQRVPEIGVRVALGASTGNVLWLVMRHSLFMILLGIGIGIAAALAAAGLLLHFVEGMRPTHPLTFAAMICVLVTAALFASFLPARHASRIDPLKALRQD